MSDVRTRIEEDPRFLDSAILSHGFTTFMRDYDVLTDVPALKPGGTGSYIEGRYRYRFTHCPEAHLRSALSPDNWKASWDDHFTDYGAWERAGEPDGFVWGVEWAVAYPGLSYVPDSARAKEWSVALDREMHEAQIETNTFVLNLVFHDLIVEQLAVGDPRTGQLTETR